MANYKGLAVGAFGGSTINQDAAANDVLTLTAITGATADFLVCETGGGGELFVIDDEGQIEGELLLVAGAQLDAGAYLRFSVPPTTPPTTGLETGDLFVTLDNTTTGSALALCVDGGNNSLRYIPFGTATFGRATA